MAIMTKELAAIMPPELRAEILFQIDNTLRQTIRDEEIFMVWLEEGIPDDIKNVKDIEELDIDAEDFTEMWNLAEQLMNADAEGR